MKVLNVDDIDEIHETILRQSGGLPGKSIERPIEAVLNRAFNHILYGGSVIDMNHEHCMHILSLLDTHIWMETKEPQ